MVEHQDWAAFQGWREMTRRRLIAFSTHAAARLHDHEFQPGDILLFGRESAGLPASVLTSADAALRIPIRPGNRSLNVAAAAAIGIAEGLRQTGGFA